MKTIGLIGGMSWESSAEYYRILNEMVRERLGGHHSAKIVLHSFDFAELERYQHEGNWEDAGRILVETAGRLEQGGAEIILICANTMHKLYGEVQEAVRVPVLHIVDAVAEAIKDRELSTVGLLGTRFTMEDEFYRKRLRDIHGIETIVPDQEDRERVHRIIYDELCHGVLKEGSKQEYLRIIQNIGGRGGEGVILGCTEIPLLVKQDDSSMPLFDTTMIHAQAALELALQD